MALTSQSLMKRAALPLYPFGASIYPVLGLAAFNSGELIRPADLVGPLLISLIAALLAWLGSRIATRDIHKRALVTLLFLVIFNTYGYAADALKHSYWFESAGEDVIALPLAILLLIAAADLLRRSPRSFEGATVYLNVVIAVLVVWCGATVGWHVSKENSRRPATLSNMLAPRARTSPETKPHVFLVILDKYTGPRSLRANYGFDDRKFLDSLRGHGYFVPGNSHANYVHTFLALAAMLNWEYLDSLPRQLGVNSSAWSPAYPLIENNRTWHALKQLGYKFIFLPTALPATASNRYADIQLPDPSRMTHEFEAAWLHTTVLVPLLDAVCALRHCSAGSLPYVPESAESIDSKFTELPRLAESEQPVFVFAHFTVPHEPYIYDAQCRHRTPYWPKSDAGAEESQVKTAYVQQIECVNRKVQQMVEEIQRHAARPTIVMLQADHGHGRLGRDQPPLRGTPQDRVAERVDIFGAYYLPGAPSGLLNDSIGPVNVMRAVMRHYFGFDLPELQEKTYWSSSGLPYRFTRIR
jgi:sulfatase-like protein